MKFSILKNYRKDKGGKMSKDERKVVELLLPKVFRSPFVRFVDSKGKTFLLRGNLPVGRQKPSIHVQISRGGIDGIKRYDVKTK